MSEPVSTPARNILGPVISGGYLTRSASRALRESQSHFDHGATSHLACVPVRTSTPRLYTGPQTHFNPRVLNMNTNSAVSKGCGNSRASPTFRSSRVCEATNRTPPISRNPSVPPLRARSSRTSTAVSVSEIRGTSRAPAVAQVRISASSSTNNRASIVRQSRASARASALTQARTTNTTSSNNRDSTVSQGTLRPSTTNRFANVSMIRGGSRGSPPARVSAVSRVRGTSRPTPPLIIAAGTRPQGTTRATTLLRTTLDSQDNTISITSAVYQTHVTNRSDVSNSPVQEVSPLPTEGLQSGNLRDSPSERNYASLPKIHEAPLSIISIDESQEYMNVLHCPVCLSNIQKQGYKVMVPLCGHFLCDSCLELCMMRKPICPMCLRPVESVREMFL